jgi:hypothetical protein
MGREAPASIRSPARAAKARTISRDPEDKSYFAAPASVFGLRFVI